MLGCHVPIVALWPGLLADLASLRYVVPNPEANPEVKAEAGEGAGRS